MGSRKKASNRMSFLIPDEECQICFDSCPIYLFCKITPRCNHNLDICNNCVGRHISVQLDSKNVDINCPFSKCNQKLSPDDIKRISIELFDRFDKLMLFQTLSQIPEFRWCKTSGCDYGQIHEEGDKAPIMTCTACGGKSCYTHDIPWHKDTTCSNYELSKRGDDEATKGLLDKETRPCPKCGVRIIKNGGCNHMTCRVTTCKFEFCWLCSADFNKIRQFGNRFHKKGCKLYA